MTAASDAAIFKTYTHAIKIWMCVYVFVFAIKAVSRLQPPQVIVKQISGFHRLYSALIYSRRQVVKAEAAGRSFSRARFTMPMLLYIGGSRCSLTALVL